MCCKLRLLCLLVLLPMNSAMAGATISTAGIASAHPLATQAGHEILARGGNAFDAAVAVAASLSVVEPYSSGLGGGGFFLLHRARDGYEVMIDARERAPLAATRDMYLDSSGNPVPGLSVDGPLAAGIPGIPAGLAHLAKNYGRLSFKELLAPAIRLARDGFPVTAQLSRMTLRQQERLKNFPETARIFLNKGFIHAVNERWQQPDLARTLDLLARKGRAGFYAGNLAERMVKEVRAAGGIWSMKDLAEYRVVERAPVRGKFHDVNITSAALPSSGGVALIQMLNVLSGFDLKAMNRVERFRRIIETMRLAYRDRAHHLGDADFVDVDVPRLIDTVYADELRKEILLRDTVPAEAPAEAAREGADTTHFSIIDREGNRVAATLSLNTPFGSGYMPAGTGVVLNNEMDDFSVKPNTPNTYGLVGLHANAIAPGKRPLSSMTPTFLENDTSIVVLGTPGGSRIISMVLLATLEFAQGRGTAADWVSRPRYHHQYLPDIVSYEQDAIDDAERAALERSGYQLRIVRGRYGNMQAVTRNKLTGKIEAVSDPRGEGLGLVR
jgi:gamma-glutamyltranspeptidase/glutathione hydrolase